MEINLLPKRPVWPAYRRAMIAGAVLLGIGGIGSSFYYYVGLSSDVENLRLELARVQQDNTVLTAERTMNAQTKRYTQLRSAVDKLLLEQSDFGAMLDSVAKQLSKEAYVEALDADFDKKSLQLKLRTADATQVEQFAELLHSEAWVEKIVITSIQQSTAITGSNTDFTAQIDIKLKPRKA